MFDSIYEIDNLFNLLTFQYGSSLTMSFTHIESLSVNIYTRAIIVCSLKDEASILYDDLTTSSLHHRLSVS